MAPKQKPGRSRQDYQTPKEFLLAVYSKFRLGEFEWDLAASRDNTVADQWFDVWDDALAHEWWKLDGALWCNPPYARIAPWVQKAWFESRMGAKVLMLLPAAVGSNWWRDWVHGKAHVLLLNGRLSFDGVAPYPKDCALLLYTPGVEGGYQVWDWRAELE